VVSLPLPRMPMTKKAMALINMARREAHLGREGE